MATPPNLSASSGYIPLSEPTPSPAPSSTPSSSCANSSCSSSNRCSKRMIGNPFPKSLKKRSERAAIVLADFLSHSQEQSIISDETIRNCKGLVFISMVKGGYIWSGRFGSGLVIARTGANTWSAPSAISCLGVGYGAQAGLEFTDYVIVLKDEQALNAFSQVGNVTVGVNLALAIGPWGRTGEVDLAATCALTYSFSKSRGLFGGLSLEGTLLLENKRTNEKCYGKGVTVKQILSGEVPINQEVSVLHQALHQRFYSSSSSSSPSSPSSMPPQASSSSATPAAGSFDPGLEKQQQVYPLPPSASSPSPFLPPPYHSHSEGSDQERTDDKAGLLARN